MNGKIFYYIRDLSYKTDGNDVMWLSLDNGDMRGEHPLCSYNLDEATIFDNEHADMLVSKYDNYKKYPVHKIDKLVQYHVPVSKLRRNSNLSDGELCYLLSKRDTCGKNAAFWAWDHKGYVCDVRNAQIFTYNQERSRKNREFEFFVRVSKVKSLIQKRIDIQDLRADRNVTHVLERDYFKSDELQYEEQ